MCAPRLGRGLLELDGLGRGPEGFVLVGTDVTDLAVDTVGVVDAVDSVRHRDHEFEGCCPSPGVEQLDLHPTPERLDHRIVETIADRPERWCQP